MHRRAILLLTCALCTFASYGDQTDARLDGLFEVLQDTTDINRIRVTENQIWGLWLQHPNADVERLMELGTQRMNSQQYNDALLIFTQLIESFPDYAEAWNKRATLYYIVADYDNSLADIEKTLELEPRHFGALSGLGLIHIQRGELQQAKAAFESLLKIHPHSPNAQENLDTVNEALRFNII